MPSFRIVPVAEALATGQLHLERLVVLRDALLSRIVTRRSSGSCCREGTRSGAWRSRSSLQRASSTSVRFAITW